MLGCKTPDGYILQVSDMHPFPPLPHYLPSESEIYGPGMKFVPATEAGWMISDYESSDVLNLDQATIDTSAYIHFFRYNSLPPSSIRATSKLSLGQLTDEYSQHTIHCEQISKRLRSEMWALPSEDSPPKRWTFLSKVVLAVVTWHNGVVFLNNIKSKYWWLTNRSLLRLSYQLPAYTRSDLEHHFEEYKATLRQSLEDLKANGGTAGPDSSLRTPRERLWLQNEIKRIQEFIDVVDVIKLDKQRLLDMNSKDIPEVRPYYCELRPDQQMDIWVDLFNIDIAASIYWAVHPTIAIERNFHNEKGMGAVMLQTFCVAAMRTWNHFVGPYLVKDKERCQTNILTTKPINPDSVYDGIEEVVDKYFDSRGFLKSSIEAVIVAQVTPRCTAEKQRRRRNSDPTLDLPLAKFKRVKVE